MLLTQGDVNPEQENRTLPRRPPAANLDVVHPHPCPIGTRSCRQVGMLPASAHPVSLNGAFQLLLGVIQFRFQLRPHRQSRG